MSNGQWALEQEYPLVLNKVNLGHSLKKDRIKLHKILSRKIFFSLLKKIIAKLRAIYSTPLVMSDC